MKTFLYIDGFNLYYSALKDTPLRWLDPVALASTAFPRNRIVTTKFFTAKVTPLPHDPRQPDRQQAYWRALRTLPALEIIEGDFRTRKVRAKVVNPPPNTIEVYKTEEKGSDVNLGAHLLMDGFLNCYDAAIVITGDSDLVTPIQMACRELKKPVGILNPQRLSGPEHRPPRRSAGLQKAAAFYQNGVTWNQLHKAQFSNPLIDAHGTFHKPTTW
ncbi:MAG: NYN domain-containing protein [Verrucomicrobiota bacterium]